MTLATDAQNSPAAMTDEVFVFPTSFAQQRLWFLDQLDPGSPAYNIPTALHIKGQLKIAVLKQSIAQLIARHESLRTTFASRAGDPLQIVHPTLKLTLPVVDLQSLPHSQQTTVLQYWINQIAQLPFDLGVGPLLRVTVIQLAPAEYIVSFTIHHIIADGLSIEILIQELALLYASFTNNYLSPLSPLSIQYADFSIWQREQLQGERLAAQLTYWQQHLQDVPPVLALPTVYPRPVTQSFRGARQSFQLSAPLTQALRHLGQQEKATLFMTLLAVFKTLLYRYSGQADILVGSPIANRNRPELETVIGLFANTLVLRTHVSGHLSFRQLLRQVRTIALDAYAHQDLPFEQLVDSLKLERTLNHNPLFQVMFILQNATAKQLELPELTLSNLEITNHIARFDLTLLINDTGSELVGAWEYSTDLFDAPFMKRMAEHFQILLEAIVTAPDQPITDLPLLTPTEQQRLISWNQTQTEFQSPPCLHHLFETQATLIPDAIALVYENQQLTYAYLNQQAHRLAQQLQALGVGPDTPVGVCLERTPQLLITLLGILKAGGAYLPLDPSYPTDRLNFMLADSQAPLLLTQTILTERFPDYQGQIICLDATGNEEQTQNSDSEEPEFRSQNSRLKTQNSSKFSPSSLAYIIYTSGSTGRPKGVQIPHQAVVNFLHSMARMPGLTDQDVLFAVTTLSFDIAVLELFLPLTVGARLVMASRAVAMDGTALAQYLDTVEATVMQATPATWRLLLETNWSCRSQLRALCGGEALPNPLAQQILEGCNSLWNLYGPTETTIWSAATPVNLAETTNMGTVAIGRAIANTEFYVLDSHGQPVPIGIAGELHIGGKGLARGYWQRPELTAEKFIPNPFRTQGTGNREQGTGNREQEPRTKNQEPRTKNQEPRTNSKFKILCEKSKALQNSKFEESGVRSQESGVKTQNSSTCRILSSRLYKTGDLVSQSPDGKLDFLGRIDQQVKIRGFRIELGEIEAHLNQHPQVQSAVVLAQTDRVAGQRLVAYFVPAGEQSVSPHELQHWLQQSLPSYMVPSTFVALAALPLTANGKVNRRALAAFETKSLQTTAGQYIAPRTPIEEMLAGIWGEVLGIERVGVFDHFFEVGGHSLLATRIVARMRQSFKVEIPLKQLFESPTVAGLAEAIQVAMRTHQKSTPRSISRIARDQELPLSFAQQRLWFLEQLQPGNPFYNIPAALRLSGPLNIPAFARSLQTIVQRHESLRTTFKTVKGKPLQVIAPTVAMDLAVVDLRSLPSSTRENEARYLAMQASQHSFNLAQGPLFQSSLLQLSETDYVVLFNIHHIISDQWSIGVLSHELTTFYEAFSQGKSITLPELPIQYADFAHWQRQWLHEATVEPEPSLYDRQLKYWQQQLADIPTQLQLPTDRPRPPVQTFRGATQSLEISPDIAKALRTLSQQSEATLFMTLLAAFQSLLHRYTGQTDILVGSPVANRTQAATEILIGFFVNILVLRAQFWGNPSFQNLLAQVRETALEAYAHQDLPFEKLVEELQIERDLSRDPLIQVMLVFQEAVTPITNPHISLTPLEFENSTAKFDLTLFVADTQSSLVCTLEYNTDLFNRDTIANLLVHFQNLLAGIVANPHQPVSELPLLTRSEQYQLLAEWNQTQADYPFTSVTQLFEAQVEKTPDGIALVAEQQQLTYQALNQQANQLGQQLQALGVGPEVRVGIYLERSLEMVIGLLGILKAGGAYVPLDPSYPQERIAFMVADAQVSVLLTKTSLKQTLPDPGTSIVLCIDEEGEAIAPSTLTNPAPRVTPNNLAYVIYTSGSTGRPKGVMISHRAIYNHMAWMQQEFPLTPEDKVLQKTPFSFDASVWEFYAPLLRGAELHLAKPKGHKDIAYLAEVIAQRQITTVQFVPSLLNLLLQETAIEACTSLKRVFCGGEALSSELQQHALTKLSATLHNLYGPTEACIDTTYWTCSLDRGQNPIPIGCPIANVQVYILDQALQPLPLGVPGELHISGVQVARGYLNRPELTAEKFIPNPFRTQGVGTREEQIQNLRSQNSSEFRIPNSEFRIPFSRLYKTGDLARYRPDGTLEFLGRIDHQVKIRGFRIELGEVEAALTQHPNVHEAVVLARTDEPGAQQLVAYIVPTVETDTTNELRISSDRLRADLKARLPGYMVPSLFLQLEALPLTANGKVNRQQLPAPKQTRPDLEAAYIPPQSDLEQLIAAVWQTVLPVDKIGIHDNFFDVGGHSLLLVQVHSQLQEQIDLPLTIMDLFKYPTVSTLAQYLSSQQQPQSEAHSAASQFVPRSSYQDDIAIVGMAGRFPGAQTVGQFWQNLCDGVESITFFTDAELIDAGIDAELIKHPDYVKAQAILDGIEEFDASFFGFTAREAEFTDPQQRLFLESAWEALEQAGGAVDNYPGKVGVFAGVATSTYLFNNLATNPEQVEMFGAYQTFLGNERDFLTTQVSYKLNLRGPSFAVQTACSTSLVAVHLACQSLLQGESDLALAGGASVKVPSQGGYLYQSGGIQSADGHCRAFDAKAQGTVFGSGVGVVVLKRLQDALADGDTIAAVIKGSAINNDGALKVGYTAPSIDGQTGVIEAAIAQANVNPETITYIETHGTGTVLGDPIEMTALTQAFRQRTQQQGFCAIGSVKTNVGHLDTAAGVVGLIKTVLALQHQQIPASLNFESPNPQINFADSPFYVNTTLANWPTTDHPRRAGVSSFGIGGTNAHLILEEAPSVKASSPSRPWQILPLSAKTATALEATANRLVEYLQQYSTGNLADVAYTLQIGRKSFDHRCFVICQDQHDAVECLTGVTPQRRFNNTLTAHHHRPIIFMFPGQGAQYPNMGWELYQTEPIFRTEVDRCCQLIEPLLGTDLRPILYPEFEYPEFEPSDNHAPNSSPPRLHAPIPSLLNQTTYTQPALFITEYALAQLWFSWGIKPEAMIGHSIGEYVAACLAGVLTLPDALALVVARGQLMQQAAAGAMLSIPLAVAEVEPLLDAELALAAVNAPKLCVVSGAIAAIAQLQAQLAQQGVECRRLKTSQAFHSPFMEPILAEFTERVAQTTLAPPQIAVISNVTGTWMTASEATDPAYWARHLRQTVQFSAGIQTLTPTSSTPILLEVGPGKTLSTLARHNRETQALIVNSMRHPKAIDSDQAILLGALGQLWLAGLSVDWSGFSTHEQRHRLPLPTYPFERQHYWIEPGTSHWGTARADGQSQPLQRLNVEDWLYRPVWQQSIPLESFDQETFAAESLCWLIFIDACGVGTAIARQLQQAEQTVITVTTGKTFQVLADSTYTIRPDQADDYHTLFKELRETHQLPQHIVHLWGVTAVTHNHEWEQSLEQHQQLGFYSLLCLSQGLTHQTITENVQLTVITNNVQAVTGDEPLCAPKSTILGPCQVIPQEYPAVSCRHVDILFDDVENAASDADTSVPWETENARLMQQLLSELGTEVSAKRVAYRGANRWIQEFEPVAIEQVASRQLRWREGGVYLLTGGLGGIGLVLAEHLAASVPSAKLILLGRSAFPAPETWSDWIDTHDATDNISHKIQQVQALETLGAEVLVLQADVVNREQMRAALEQATTRFGPIHGVLHMAGIAGEGIAHLKTIEAAASVLAPKVNGTLILDALLDKNHLDFCVLFSSLTAILGGVGQIDYCGANVFLDSFAQAQAHRDGPFTIAINWDAWQTVGMAVNAALPAHFQHHHNALLAEDITPAEGRAVFDQILHSRLPQVIVSTKELQAQRQQYEAAWSLDDLVQQTPEISPIDPQSIHPRPALTVTYVAPRNEIEQTIADIWQALLGFGPVGIYDDFLELGGHSLLAVQLIFRLRQQFQVELPINRLFESPTIATLASLITEQVDVGGAIATIPKIDRIRAEQQHVTLPSQSANEQPQLAYTFPLSFSQQRLWFLDQLQPQNAAYNIPIAVRLTGQLNLAALAHTFNTVVQRHEVLRTRFAIADGNPIQVIVPHLTLPLPLVDLQDIPLDQRDTEIFNWIKILGRQPFDLAQGPLLRSYLFHLNEAEHVAVFVMHHIVSDGWSMGVLIQELTMLYAAYGQSQFPLPELPIQYADYAVWQRQWFQGDIVKKQLAYWQEQLDGAAAHPPLPTDNPRPEIPVSQGEWHTFSLSARLTDDLKTMSHQTGVTFFMLLLAGYATLLAHYSKQDDILVGSPVANRNRPELEGLIGFFINTIVLRTDLSGDPDFRSLLERVRKMTLGAYAHQDLPFEQLVESLQIERDRRYNPLFQTWFVLQPASAPTPDLFDLTISPLTTGNKVARFDLKLELIDSVTGLDGIFEYKTDLFNATTIQHMAQLFEALLQKVVEQPDIKLSALEQLLLETEQQQHTFEEQAFKQTRQQKLQKLRRTRRQATRNTTGESPL